MRIILVLVVAASGLTACASGGEEGDERVDVVTALHPLAEVARAVGGAHVRVTDLTPPGVEPHDLELKPSDVDTIEDAEIVLLIGNDFQPAVERAARRSDTPGRLVDVLPAGEDDSHIWLDPTQLIGVTAKVRDALTRAAPALRAEFTRGAADLSASLERLDTDFEAGLATCARRTIVTAHSAFGHLSRRYELEEVGIAGLDPAAEPSPGRVEEVAGIVASKGVTTIFTEELVSPKVAEALAREADVKTAVLDPIEGELPATESASYDGRMRANLAALRAALDCT